LWGRGCCYCIDIENRFVLLLYIYTCRIILFCCVYVKRCCSIHLCVYLFRCSSARTRASAWARVSFGTTRRRWEVVPWHRTPACSGLAGFLM
jgi:hypothetical protein